MAARIAVIYYSATGNVHMLAEAIAEGASETGAEVRLRRVPELAPEEAIQQNQLWAKHRDETAETVEEAEIEDLRWADGYAFGTRSASGTPRRSSSSTWTWPAGSGSKGRWRTSP